jgi:hypothetical protein
VLGVLLAFLGVLIALPALARAGDLPHPHWRPFFMILIGVGAFGFTLRQFGMVPATFILVGIAAYAQDEVRPVPTLVLGAGLAALAWLVFAKGLGVLIPAFEWPF